MSINADARTGRVQSVDRALTLLELLSREPRGLRLSELAAESCLAPSTAHRLLTTLEHRHFVVFDRTSGTWHVGRTAFAVGATFARGWHLSAPSLPLLRLLRDETRETANLGFIEDGQMMLLSQVQSREISRTIADIGGRAPAVASGIGKAILAAYSERDVANIVARQGFQRWTSKSIMATDELLRDLDSNRRLGYSVDDEEHRSGLVCVAAVVYGREAEPVCAISVSGMKSRLPPERIPRVGRQVVEMARQLSSAIGGSAPARLH